ncbi:hypothetical protein ACFYOF_16765 [Streptomyces sp. NPDC007148]|uniref:hypothetical protein n=1 Tax=Streptomyces sp. NPDC007148 TaxID=3364775 RepID=UPI0036C6D9C4
MTTEATGAPERAEQQPGRTEGPIDPRTPPGGSPETHHAPATDEARAAAHFADDAKTHKLKECREDGVFRHLEFVGLAGLSRLVLVTWPYNLLVAGSHGSFHFERYGKDTEDMFDWLRGARVSPASWASKLVNGRQSVEEYDRARLEQAINELVAEAVRDGWAPDGLESKAREEILDSHWMDEEQNALRLVSEFQLGMRYRSECSCGESAEHDSYSSAVCWNALTHHGSGPKHKVNVRQTGGFTFDDFTEWNIRKLDYHFLYQCHAAVWGIAQYDAAQKPAGVSA